MPVLPDLPLPRLFGFSSCDGAREEFREVFDYELTREGYKQAVIDDPNEFMVDKRFESVDDVRNRLEQWVGAYSAGAE